MRPPKFLFQAPENGSPPISLLKRIGSGTHVFLFVSFSFSPPFLCLLPFSLSRPHRAADSSSSPVGRATAALLASHRPQSLWRTLADPFPWRASSVDASAGGARHHRADPVPPPYLRRPVISTPSLLPVPNRPLVPPGRRRVCRFPIHRASQFLGMAAIHDEHGVGRLSSCGVDESRWV